MALDRQFSRAEAFDLSPIGVLDIGGVEYPVLPLTLQRFHRLLAYDLSGAFGSLSTASGFGGNPTMPPGTANAALRRRGFISRLCARLRLRIPLPWRLVNPAAAAILIEEPWRPAIRDLGELVCMIAPAIPRKRWDEEATQLDVCKLIYLIGSTHNWGFIWDWFTRPQDPDTEETGATTFEEGLLAFCARFPAYQISDLWAMRVEGFYHTLDAALEIVKRDRKSVSNGHAPDGDDAGMIKTSFGIDMESPDTTSRLGKVMGAYVTRDEATARHLNDLLDAARERLKREGQA